MSSRLRSDTAPRLSWPWRPDCEARLVPGGDDFLKEIRAELEQARHHIDVELYLCSSGDLSRDWFQVLAAAADRGVKVRVIFDDVGSHGLKAEDRATWAEHPGITLRWFNPLRVGHPTNALIRDHRKLIIIDRERAWTGGMGLDDNYSAHLTGDSAWRDCMVRCSGPVVEDWLELYEQVWAMADRPLGSAWRWRLHRHARLAANDAAHRDAPTARLIAARGGRRNPILHSAVRRIDQAREDVWLCTPYFLPPRILYQALKRAARRGVRVRVLVCGGHTDHPIIRYAGQHLYESMLRAGVELYEFEPCFIHLKALAVDDWASLGSFNYDRWNSSWNLEANVEWVEPNLIRHMHAMREALERECAPITLERWQRRNLFSRGFQAFMFWFGTRFLKLLRAWRGG